MRNKNRPDDAYGTLEGHETDRSICFHTHKELKVREVDQNAEVIQGCRKPEAKPIRTYGAGRRTRVLLARSQSISFIRLL